MKHFLLFLTLVFTVVGESWAQRTFILSTLRHKSFVSLTVAPSRPTVSPFGKNTQNFLENGQSAQVSVGRRLGWHWGVVGSYTYSTNPVRQIDLRRLVRENVEQPAPLRHKAVQHTLQSVMVGPSFTFQASRFVFDLQATAGFAQGSSLRTELDSMYPQKAFSSKQHTTRAPAAGGSITVRYKVFRWLALHTSAQYVTADFKNNNSQPNLSAVRFRPTIGIAPHQPLGLLQVGGGLSLLF